MEDDDLHQHHRICRTYRTGEGRCFRAGAGAGPHAREQHLHRHAALQALRERCAGREHAPDFRRRARHRGDPAAGPADLRQRRGAAPVAGGCRPQAAKGIWCGGANPARPRCEGHGASDRHAGEEGRGARRIRPEHRGHAPDPQPQGLSMANILIVEARFYEHIADMMLEGATVALKEAGAEYETISVPGALEIPAAIHFAALAGEGAGKRYDGYVALGCVIRGETYHFEIVATQSARGLMDLGLLHGLCVGNGILTVENEAQALERADRNNGDKGGGAARAALALIEIRSKLGKFR
ncbi:MAG: 6,7-dimethyl-8-ribityllumazine synthase [Alphaproteobacteria bacterium]|nr:6,7-dimethyl-8-ribityllumazine synthase [Alphaproteobacteria bacterium]